MSDHPEVNGLLLPTLLVSLIETGHWIHPGDDVLKREISFLWGPVDFLGVESMRRESRGSAADSPQYSLIFREVRGRVSATSVELPWLDADLAVFIAACRFAGDDQGIALDFRSSNDDPRVVANEWFTESHCCIWQKVAGSFTEFVQRLGL